MHNLTQKWLLEARTAFLSNPVYLALSLLGDETKITRFKNTKTMSIGTANLNMLISFVS